MGGGASSKLRSAARKIVQTCGSFSRGQSPVPVSDHHTTTTTTMSPGQPRISATPGEAAYATQPLSSTSTPKNLCAICLDPLSYGTGTSPAQAVFTAQCSHAFHFACISCNVRHGSVTCPICRAHWTQLPRNLNPSCSLFCNKTDPILQILDDSIATFRVHRRSILRSARYNDDDPIEPNSTPTHHRLHFNIIPVTLTPPSCHPCSNQSLQVTHLNSCHSYGLLSLNHLRTSSLLLAASPGGQHFAPTGKTPSLCTSSSRAYLSVTLARQPATDLVLVASPNGPHLRLIKQCMALVVFSLRPIDRLAIVTYSSAAARVFPLKRMTSYGKRTALQVIDRIFYMGQADPIEGLKKGVKILGDCTHKNPRSSILHLSDSPTRSYHRIDMENSIPIHRFHVGFGFGTSSGFVMHEFEEFLTRALGGVIKEIQLRIGENARILRLGELRGGEERRIPLILGESGHVCVEYSYIEGGIDECIRTGEILAGIRDERERVDGTEAVVSVAGRNSSVESWDYHDPYRARRWAKHLHGYRI
ncbi:E3 ubiquitin-protein ligase dma1 [Actinidia chinensis var. chinensis]|uniref:E3 ubiquitin-protein ligase dma1 n=1 Tax=Actinidia chinensis var. chinensis TaxID=1590841 RepID=A0A2R6QM18_ACTCC|nr:E3 ubiquitin-protein ligase dma1 [Actinidia chinensis var. chinensis]